MIAHRISKAIDSNNPTLSFENAWNKIFINKPVKMGDSMIKYRIITQL